jgi:hypothetical protein
MPVPSSQARIERLHLHVSSGISITNTVVQPTIIVFNWIFALVLSFDNRIPKVTNDSSSHICSFDKSVPRESRWNKAHAKFIPEKVLTSRRGARAGKAKVDEPK